MREVSAQTLQLFELAERHLELAPGALLEGTSLRYDRPPASVSWALFVRLLRRLGGFAEGRVTLDELGSLIIDLAAFRRVVEAAALIAGPQGLMRVTHLWSGPQLFPALLHGTAQAGDGTLELTIEIPPNLEDCPEMFQLNLGIIRSVPVALSREPGRIDLEVTPRRARYRVHRQPSVAPWARLRQALAVLRGDRTHTTEIELQQSLLHERFTEAARAHQARTDSLRAAWSAAEQARAEAEDAQRQAELSRRVAERALTIKEEFLATMSHEIRTPMNGVIGLTELLRQGELRPREAGYVQRLKECGDHLLRIIDDILDLSRLGKDRLPLEPHPFSLPDLLSGVAGVFERQTRTRGLALRVDLDPDVPEHLVGDSGRIRQILLNLLSNAVKFTDAGEVSLHVGAELLDTDGVELTCKVSDTGTGIPQDLLESMFDPFVQGSGPAPVRRGGTGLGLAICRQLVTLMGGRVHARSLIGEGSTFTVHLPLRIWESTAPGFTPSEVTELPTGPISPADTCILIADDDEISRIIVTRFLTQRGYRVQTAVDGQEALDAARSGTCRLVLMDCHMPLLDGFEATRQIRSLPDPLCRLPIIALTAGVLDPDRRRCREAGMDDFLPKPLDEQQLLQRVASWLAESRSA